MNVKRVLPPHRFAHVEQEFVYDWAVCVYLSIWLVAYGKGTLSVAPSPPPPSFPHITSPYRVYLGPLLGEGGFAFVYACTDVQDESRRLVLKKLIVQDQAHNV